MNQRRTLSKRTKNLKEEFLKSMESFKPLVNNRFESIALKEKSHTKKQQQKMKYKSLKSQSR